MIIGIIIVAFIAFVGLIIGCVFSMGGPAMKAGELFLTQLSSGKVDQAYESAAIKFKETVSKDVFNSFLKDYPIATKVKSVSFNSFSIENGTADLQGTVTGTDGQVSPVNMRLLDENNAWRVLYVDFMTPEEKASLAAEQQAQQQQGGQQTATTQPNPPVTGEAAQPAPPAPPAGAPGAPTAPPSATTTTAPPAGN